jgi:hypothetical protein
VTPMLTVARLLTRLAALASTCGEPCSIEILLPVQTVSIVLMTDNDFVAWKQQVDETGNAPITVRTDELGGTAEVRADTDGWHIQLAIQAPS